MGKYIAALLLLWGTAGAAAPCAEYLLPTGSGDVAAHLIGVDTSYSYYFEDNNTPRGRVWREPHDRPIDCNTHPLCLEAAKQEGADCQSHTIVNLISALERRELLPPSPLRDKLHYSQEAALDAVVAEIFEEGEGETLDAIRSGWRRRIRTYLSRNGLRLSQEREFKRLRDLDHLYQAVEGGAVAFVSFSFQRGRFTVRNLEGGPTAPHRGAYVRSPIALNLDHAAAVIGAFRSRQGNRFLIVLDSNTAAFSVWSIEALKEDMRRSRGSHGLIVYSFLVPQKGEGR